MAEKDINNPLDIIGEVSNLVGTTLTDIGTIAHSVGKLPALQTLVSMITSAFGHTEPGIKNILKHPGNIENWYGGFTSDLGLPFVEAFLRGGLGVDPDYDTTHELGLGTPAPKDWSVNPAAFRVDAQPGISELKRIIGFILATNLLSAGIGSVLKLFLAQRHAERVDTVIGTIGEQLGLGWASGEALSELFRVAAMPSIIEMINVQRHPNRLDMPTIMRLARQHHITLDQFWAALDLQGFPDDLKSLILQMDTQQLQPADLAALYGIGQMSRADVSTYLSHVGYSDGDVAKLLTLWVDHSETQELAQFRATLRADYLEGKIGPEVFTDVLAQLLTHPQKPPHLPVNGRPNYDAAPDQVRIVVDMARASADFAIAYGRTTVSIADQGRRLKAGQITPDQFRAAAQAAGYSSADAATLQQVYQIPPLAGKPGLTSAKILQYAKSGTLSAEAAYGKLIALGMSPKDAAFLAWNPSASYGPWGFPQTVGTAKQAYLDGVLNNDEAKAALQALGLADGEITEELTLWHYILTHPVTTPAELTANTVWQQQFRDSLKSLYIAPNGLGDAEVVNLLEEAGLLQLDAYYTWAGWYTQKHGQPPPGPPGASPPPTG